MPKTKRPKKVTYKQVRALLLNLQKRARTQEGRDRIQHMLDNVYTEFADPAMDAPKAGFIVLGDWNDVEEDGVVDRTPCEAYERLDKLGVAAEWLDQFTTCGDCSRVVQTEPDSYGWKPKYAVQEGELLCEACLTKDAAALLKGLEGKTKQALTLDVDPAEHGYVLVEDGFEHGLHEGQADDPKLIAAALRAQGIQRFLFRLDGVGQFDVAFSVYVHASEASKLDAKKFEEAEVAQYPTPAMRMREALANARVQEGVLGPAPAGSVRVVSLQTDGPATVRDVSGADFVAGKALDDEGAGRDA